MPLSIFDSADSDLKILVIDETPIRRAILETGLKEAGFGNVTTLGSANGLIEQIYKLDPDVILIDLDNPSRDMGLIGIDLLRCLTGIAGCSGTMRSGKPI